MAYIKDIEKLM